MADLRYFRLVRIGHNAEPASFAKSREQYARFSLVICFQNYVEDKIKHSVIECSRKKTRLAIIDIPAILADAI